MVNGDFRHLFAQMVGGQDDEFFDRHWRKEVLFTKGTVLPIPRQYSCADFLDDYKRHNPYAESLMVKIDEKGVRQMVRPGREWSASGSLDNGGSLVLQAIALSRDSSNVPPIWKFFVDLHYDLCEYLLPGMPPGLQPDGAVAAVDIFYTSDETSTGGHYDTGDVFYFVLDGEKEWTLELTPDPATVLQLFTSKENKYMNDHPPTNNHIAISVKPGDCLYVPPYTYHRVSSRGATLAVSTGLPSYTEATLLKTVLTRLQRQDLIWNPLPSYPKDKDRQFHEAQKETARRVTELLHKMSANISAIADETLPRK